MDAEPAEPARTIKGAIPASAFGFSLARMLIDIPFLSSEEAVTQLTETVNASRALTGAPDGPIRIENLDDVVLNPSRFVSFDSYPEPRPMQRLPDGRPYPFGNGPAGVQENAVAWADSNLKVSAERIGGLLSLPGPRIESLAWALLRGFGILLRADGGLLCDTMGFNTSPYLQERLVQLALGGRAHVVFDDRDRRGAQANKLVELALTAVADMPLEELIPVSLAVGSSRRAMLRFGLASRDDAHPSCQIVQNLAEHATRDASALRFPVDASDTFLRKLSRGPQRLGVVLDDNGEAAADVLVVQRLLQRNAELCVVFVLNEYPLSVNISRRTFEKLLGSDLYAPLRRACEDGRVELVFERQMFNNLHPELLSPTTREALLNCDACYLRGVGLFEVFTKAGAPERYHAFIVHGPSSISVTGMEDGDAVFARIEPDAVGYAGSGRSLRTLRELSAQRLESHA
ncbi:ARMT1-like domain-containing protein [Actinoplanes sp. NPDC048791]|uniref:ARMT1-like domain-containing protein n=1 Tax=Actinoplanes sp. NPDC048791 TaxID=3154623 RepID=UPI0033F8F07F